ncbi:hypothetical protein ACTG9Q_15465 [Actinokineospora sp. 24-640]
MSFVRRLAAFMAAAALSVPMMVVGGSSASAATCLNGTRTSFHALGSPFTGGTTLTWSVTTACASLNLTLNGQAVGLKGAMTVHPAATTNYELRAKAGSTTAKLGTRTAIAGRIVGYVRGAKGVWLERENTGPGIAQARRISGQLLSALGYGYRGRFVGKVIEIHIIPGETNLTNLFPFTGLKRTGGQNDRPWSEVRGAGGLVIENTNRVAVAVGAEELGDTSAREQDYGNGYVMAHELAHAIMDHMAPTSLEADVGLALSTYGNSDHLGDDGYSKSNADEYWAENSAAIFEYEYGQQFDGEYNEKWIVDNHPRMHTLVSRVFSNR